MITLAEAIANVPDGQFLLPDFPAQLDDGTEIVITAVLERVTIGHEAGQDDARQVFPIRRLSVQPLHVRYAPLGRHELQLRRARYRAGSVSPWRTHPGAEEAHS